MLMQKEALLKKPTGIEPVGFSVAKRQVGLLEQRQHTLSRLVGLCQHRSRSLCEDLALRQGCGFLAVVSIHDGAA